MNQLRFRSSYPGVIALLAFHAWMVLNLIPRWSATYNEPGHIVAGLADWHTGRFDFYKVNPPLPRMVSTIALLNQPTISLHALEKVNHYRHGRHELLLGKYFADTNALDFDRIVTRTRLAGVLWVTIGGIIIWHWVYQTCGHLPALLSLSLWTFEPTITAHAALATADTPAAVTGLAATYTFAVYCRERTLSLACIAGLMLGLSLLCKFTHIILPPIWALVWLTRNMRVGLDRRGRSTADRGHVSHLLAIVILGLVVVNAGYEFCGTFTPFQDLPAHSDIFRRIQNAVRGTIVGDIPCPIPVSYVEGLDIQQKDFEGGMRSYFCGEWRTSGWWYYYICAFVMKSPLGHLAVYAAAVFSTAKRRSASSLLCLPIVAYFAAASAKTGFTNHLRYVLPAYPYLMIFSGIAFSHISQKNTGLVKRVFPVIAIAISSLSMLLTYPNSLGFFQPGFWWSQARLALPGKQQR